MSNNHAQHIEAWIEKAGEGLSKRELVILYELAIHALWQRSLTPLSEVTLVAIFERVLNNTQKTFPLLTYIRLEPNGVVLDGINGKAAELSIAEIKQAFQFFLTELLSLLGVLTSELLTPAFYAELENVAVKYRTKEERVVENMKVQAEGKRHHE